MLNNQYSINICIILSIVHSVVLNMHKTFTLIKRYKVRNKNCIYYKYSNEDGC